MFVLLITCLTTLSMCLVAQAVKNAPLIATLDGNEYQLLRAMRIHSHVGSTPLKQARVRCFVAPANTLSLAKLSRAIDLPHSK